MKRSILIGLTLVLAAAGALLAQAAPKAQASPALEKILNRMDETAAKFRAAQADFVWEQFQSVVKETDTQKGKVYFRWATKDLQMMANIQDPTQKNVLYSDGKVQVYQPTIDQVTVYAPGKNRADVESFLVLGFGGGGHDLLKSFDVKYEGSENVGGVQTTKLDLLPKSPRVRNMFDHILMWVDPARGVSVQQQVFEPSGDFRLAKYSDIQLNQKLPDNIFKLKTTGKTKVVSPQG
ncbi:MAG: outer membrane lipoprotein-sorting protein [Acidobacteria bacterium]|nr:MAG: outer membrane lipoprotein-sorting protein [Acidobacteriota bacterium]PYY12153.1 MAG: outer membrane lipoprotein-sorting protein [Acidobacteriota bacterium]